MPNLFLEAIRNSDPQLLADFAKIIAHVVRNEIEDFHIKHLSDSQMKELNPLIRKAIYNALFAIANSHNSEFASRFVEWHINAIPDYWEEPELIPQLELILKKLNEPKNISFESTFLSVQFKTGNIFYNSKYRCLFIRPSFELKDSENKHRLRDKISAYLRKEGYRFDPAIQGYIRSIER